MKVILPVEYDSMQTEICQSFGRAPYFLIFETNTSSSKFILNQAASSPGGAGIKASQTIVDSGAEAVIVPRIGQNASDVLTSAGIKVYQSQSNNILENISLLKEGNLPLLENAHPGFHRRG